MSTQILIALIHLGTVRNRILFFSEDWRQSAKAQRKKWLHHS
jgi:hypothetical protein